MSLFSFLKQTQPILLSLHDDMVQVLQFSRHDKAVDLVGYNEITLAKGIVTEGNITDMDAFQSALTELFSQAKPRSISGDKLYTNIPHHMLYAFVVDLTPTTDEDLLKESITAVIRQHSPIPPEELALDFASAKKGRKLSYAAFGGPIKWEKRFLKACQAAGITSVEFIPEPICHKTLFTESNGGDFILFSNHRGNVFVSVFRNGLIYDSYFLTQLDESDSADCAECFGELKIIREDFTGHFGSTLKTIFVVGFNKVQQELIETRLKSEKNTLNFFDSAKMPGISELVPYENERATLFGLFHFLVKDEKPSEVLLTPAQEAPKSHKHSF